MDLRNLPHAQDRRALRSSPTKGAVHETLGGDSYTQPLAGERHVLILDGELVVLSLPSQNPIRSLTKLKPESPNVFRRIRDDGGLAEQVEFELDADGKVIRMVHNNNFSYRVVKDGSK